MILFALLVSGCGLLGGDDGEEKKFPEPPDRPSASRVVAGEVVGDRVDALDAVEMAWVEGAVIELAQTASHFHR